MSDEEDLTLDGTTNQVKKMIFIVFPIHSLSLSLQSSYGGVLDDDDDDEDDEGTRGSNSQQK